MFDNILIKTPEQIEGIRAACRDAALVLDYIEPFVKVGVTTEYLDDLMLRYTEDVLKDMLSYSAPADFHSGKHLL